MPVAVGRLTRKARRVFPTTMLELLVLRGNMIDTNSTLAQEPGAHNLGNCVYERWCRITGQVGWFRRSGESIAKSPQIGVRNGTSWKTGNDGEVITASSHVYHLKPL